MEPILPLLSKSPKSFYEESFLSNGDELFKELNKMRKEQIKEHPLYEKTRINVTFRVWNYKN